MERIEGYYPIKIEDFDDTIIAYWYNGTVDFSGRKSSGYFDCSNHWFFKDFGLVYSNQVIEVGEIISF